MGYYSNFRLEATGFADRDAAEFFEFKLGKLSGYSGWEVTVGADSVRARLGEAKWYDAEEHVKALSVAFPSVTIDLEVEGEEHGDMWKLRARNGQTERVAAKLVYGDFQSLT
jgi:hypothetical protein